MLLDWLEQAKPDVALLQELKSTDETFPRELIEALGYQVETHGQKSFNGVAIMSRLPLEDISRGLPGDDSDEQARYMEGTVIGDKSAVRVACLYLPNGNPAPGPKYDYKLAWMGRLEACASRLIATEEPALLAGDFNVIPQAEDCWDPAVWKEDALFLPQSREAFRRIESLGFSEAYSIRHPGMQEFTFWNYRAGAWNKDHGIRIDHFMLSPAASDLLLDCQIDTYVRGLGKPSDHVPIWVRLDG